MQFGAVEIPIGVPNADGTLSILSQLDARAQLMGQNVAKSFSRIALPAIEGFQTNAIAGAVEVTRVMPPALNAAGEAAEGLGHRLSHLGVAGSFALTNLANGSEQGVTRLAHSLAIFGGAFGPAALAITTFVAVAGEQLLDWYRKSAEAADKATEALRRVREEHRQGKLGDLHENVNRTQEQIFDLDKAIKDKQAEIETAKAALPSASRAGRGTRDTAGLEEDLKALQRQKTDLVSLTQEGAREIAKIQKEIADEKARKAKEEADKDLAAQKRLQEAGDRLAAAGGDHLLRTHAFINEQARKFDEASEAARVKDEEAFYRQLEVEERDYREARRRAREADLEHQRQVDTKAVGLARQTASLIGDTVAGAFQGTGLDAFGDSVLKVIGDILVRIGEAMLAASPFLKSIAASLLNPETWLAGSGELAAVGLIALGSGLGAAGSHHGGGGARSFGGGGGFSYGQAVVSTITPNYTPNTTGVSAKAPVTLQMTVFGKRDPTFQRELLEAIAVAQGRGSTAG